MKIIRKIKIKTKKYTIRRFKILDCIPLLDYIKIDRKNKKTLKFYYFAKHSSPKKNQRIFYLKVHNINKTSIDCIRQWVKIADKMNAFIYFVCDNKHMQNEIFRNVIFKHCGFEFIETDKSSIKIVNSLIKNSNKLWKRIAKPMITPFLHAKKYGYNISYNIDADDILFLIEPQKAADAFFKAEKFAQNNNLDLFNFDMMVSKTFGVHWSFGVVLCLDPDKCLSVMENNKNWDEITDGKLDFDLNYIEKYNFNMDWFFTYLRDTKQLRMKTFYIENGVVVHMPEIILKPCWAFMLQWENGRVYCPIFKNIYNDDVWGERLIYPECIKIDVEINEKDYINVLKNLWGYIDSFEYEMLNYSEQRKLLPDFNYIQYKYANIFQGGKMYSKFYKKYSR